MEKDNFLMLKYVLCSYFGVGYMLEFLFGNIVVMYVSNMSLLVFDEFIIEIWVCLMNVGESVV